VAEVEDARGFVANVSAFALRSLGESFDLVLGDHLLGVPREAVQGVHTRAIPGPGFRPSRIPEREQAFIVEENLNDKKAYTYGPCRTPIGSSTDPRAEKRRLLTRTLAGGALAQAGYTDTLVLSRESAREVLTAPRLELLDRLRSGPVDSVRALADELDRDKGGVSRDLATLAALDVLEYEPAGRAKRPRLKHETVLVEPVT
jgi:predicted transcriptional regulator